MAIEQERYQVRFDWGPEGALAVGADADVIVWVDALAPADPPLDDLPAPAAVIAVGLPDAAAAARWVLALQERLGSRIRIAIVAAGARREGGGRRTAVEDLLAAGAVIDALAALGLDATSPEAAAAEAAYRALRPAAGHLLTASVTATALAERPPASLGRVDPARTPEDVRVARPHPGA